MKDKRTGQILTSFILFTGALLSVSLLGLAGNIAAAVNTCPEPEEPYPALYGAADGVFAEPADKTVYFTFDDGPSPNTEVLLDMLAEEGVKATFFVCAQAEDREYSARLLRRMRDEGHTIALHTYTHQYKEVYCSLESYLTDLSKVNDFVFQCTGIYADIVRFPGGSCTSGADPALMRSLADELTRRGYIFYDWTAPSGDDGAKAAPSERIAENILAGINGRQVEIVLCHDNATPTTTPEAVRSVIHRLREEGYAFDRLTTQVPPVQLIYGAH